MHMQVEAATRDAGALVRALLGAVSPDVFINTCLGKTFVQMPGPADRFTGLLTWSDINSILETRAFTSATLRMTKSGKDIPPETYLQEFTRSNKPPLQTRVVAKTVVKELADGATLILNGIQQMWPPLARLADALERALRVKVNINMYACTSDEKHGFGCHYDSHDVLVLQLLGRKHWQVFGPRAVTPYPHEAFAFLERPPVEQPIWDENLGEGQALYVPRGWWHFVRAVGEPTIHLSVGLFRPHGLDLLNWLVKQLSDQQLFRRDIPDAASEEAHEPYLADVRKALANATASGALLAEYYAHQRIGESETPRGGANLPWSAGGRFDSAFDASEIHLTSPSALDTHELAADPSAIHLYANGAPSIKLRRRFAGVCAYVREHAPVPVAAVIAELTPAHSPDVLRALMLELAQNQLIVLRQPAGCMK